MEGREPKAQSAHKVPKPHCTHSRDSVEGSSDPKGMLGSYHFLCLFPGHSTASGDGSPTMGLEIRHGQTRIQ
jgi:hypothetical protein